MKDRNIEDIDQMFREGLTHEKSPIPIPAGEWGKMELRLNRYDQRKRGIIWLVRLGSVAALILVFFIIGILITDRVPPVDEQAMVKQNDQTQHADKSITMDSLQPASRAPEQHQTHNLNNESSLQASLPKQIKKGQKWQSEIKDELAYNRNKQQAASQELKVAGRTENVPLQRDTVNKGNTAPENTMEEPVATAKEQNPMLRETAPQGNERASQAEEPVFAAAEEPIKHPRAERRVPKMALSVMAAPAYNGVNNLNNGSMGGDFGLLVSLEIAPNWNVSTGGIYAKKLYETGFRDYNPKNNIWHEYYPQTVNADCRVLDIPVNLSYTFFKTKGRTVSMGTGLSSYIMLREDYRFTYAKIDPDTPLAYRVVNENRHWLNVVNFQASIEQRLSKRISISLQPYMKIPLAEIGFAGVKLQSMGLAANLNWNFSL